MKLAIFIALLFSVALAQECPYPARDDGYYLYDSTFLNTTDSNGNMWFFQNGCFEYTETSPCPTNSPVCVILAGSSEPVSAATQTPEDSYSYTENGLEFIFSSETSCYSETIGEKAVMKTTLDFNCDPLIGGTVLSIVFDGCFAIITANSSSYCEITDVADGEDFPQYSSDLSSPVVTVVTTGPIFFSFGVTILFFFGFLLSVCLCCCCVVRRRRQLKMQAAARQFSNVAFQPIPYSNPIRQPISATNGNVPTYNPYLGQPQIVYYYPTQAQAQAQPQLVPLQPIGDNIQEDSDEKFAKELQAQFDREGQV